MAVTTADNIVAITVITNVSAIPGEFYAITAAVQRAEDAATEVEGVSASLLEAAAVIQESTDASAASAEAAALSAIEAENHALTGLAIAQSTGELYPYIDYATADGDKANRPLNSFIQVINDENYAPPRRVAYQVTAGPVLTFVRFLDNNDAGFEDYTYLPQLNGAANRKLAITLGLIPEATPSLEITPKGNRLGDKVISDEDLFTFSRGSGATWLNHANCIVGIDFTQIPFVNNTLAGRNGFDSVLQGDVITSQLSGTKGNNRHWEIGTSVKLSDEANSNNYLLGTVTSYDYVNQDIEITVISAGGTGNPSVQRLSNLELRRRTFDAVTGKNIGILVEDAATNYLLNSKDFSNAAWTKSSAGTGTDPVISIAYDVAPDGGDATRIVFNRGGGGTTGDRSTVAQPCTTSSTDVTHSLWVKSNTGVTQNLLIYNLYGGQGGEVFSVGTEWKRVSFSTTASTSNGMQFGTRGGDIADFFNGGDESLDLLVWEAQIEDGLDATSNIPTRTVAATRAKDFLDVSLDIAQLLNLGNGFSTMAEWKSLANKGGGILTLVETPTFYTVLQVTDTDYAQLRTTRGAVLNDFAIKQDGTQPYVAGDTIKVTFNHFDDNVQLVVPFPDYTSSQKHSGYTATIKQYHVPGFDWTSSEALLESQSSNYYAPDVTCFWAGAASYYIGRKSNLNPCPTNANPWFALNQRLLVYGSGYPFPRPKGINGLYIGRDSLDGSHPMVLTNLKIYGSPFSTNELEGLVLN